MHLNKNYILFLILFSQFFLTAGAQRVLTLEEAIATTLQNNYDIQLSKNDSLIAAIDYSYRNAVFLPNINGSGTTVWNASRQKMVLTDTTRRTGIQANNSNLGLNVNWVLFDGFKMFATRDKTALLVKQGGYAVQQQIINTLANVITTYYNVARQEQLINATDVQIKLNEDRTKLTQYKLEIGAGAKPDVLQSRIDLNEQQALKLQQLNNVYQLKQQLVQYMNTHIQPEEFIIPDTIPLRSISLGDLQDGLDNVNPALLLARNNIEIAKYTLIETRASLYPTIALASNYNFARTASSVAINQFSPLLNLSNGVNTGLTASIPIFNQFRVRKQIKKDEVNINYQQLQYESQKTLINLSLINAFHNYEMQLQQLKIEEENITYAKELLFIESEKYRLGRGTMIELRQAQVNLAQANDRLISARYNAKVSETELMKLKGVFE